MATLALPETSGLDTRLPIPFRRKVLRLAQGALYWSRGLNRLPRRGGATILMYHSVAPAETAKYIDVAWRMPVARFEAQARFLAQHRRVIALGDLARQLKSGVEPEPGTVVLTFDDGYRDNLQVAAPILQRYGLPAMVFLATAYVGNGENQWIDRLYTMFTTRRRQRCELPPKDKGSATRVFDLQDKQQCRQAYHVCNRWLVESSYAERREVLALLEQQLEPREQPPRLTLNWDEVRELAARYPACEIGVHTANHVDLSRCSVETVGAELQRCIRDVEQHLGARPRYFSFPYGRSSQAARRLLPQYGLAAATGGGGHRLIDCAADPYDLTRLDALMSPTQLKLRTHPAFGSLPDQLAKGH